MKSSIISFALTAAAAASVATGSPLSNYKRALKTYTSDVQIHESCNATQREYLTEALADVVNITTWARNYVTINGPRDPLYQKWFGNGDYVAVIGVFDALLYGNKQGVIFRCDNPDGNCEQEGWAGHWRGSNATSETVICELSYQIREPLSEFCENNYTVAGSSPSYYWATDLVHRLYHVPTVADEEVGHVADDYNDCLELAKTNSTWAPYNTHTLQYFMAEVFANEVARPGVGCTGEAPAEDEHDHDHDGHSHDSQSTATATSSAAASCHTHSDGEVHCA